MTSLVDVIHGDEPAYPEQATADEARRVCAEAGVDCSTVDAMGRLVGRAGPNNALFVDLRFEDREHAVKRLASMREKVDAA